MQMASLKEEGSASATATPSATALPTCLDDLTDEQVLQMAALINEKNSGGSK